MDTTVVARAVHDGPVPAPAGSRPSGSFLGHPTVPGRR